MTPENSYERGALASRQSGRGAAEWQCRCPRSNLKTSGAHAAYPRRDVNESAKDQARTLNLFASGKPTEWRNRLIWGDKK
jgi:hypothetical protein